MSMLMRALLLLGIVVPCAVGAGASVAPAHAALAGAGLRDHPAAVSALAEAGPALHADPASLTLGAGESASVVLTLTAPSSTALKAVSVVVYRNGSFRVALRHPFAQRIRAGAAGLAVISVSASEIGLVSGSVTAVVSARMGVVATALTVSVPVSERPATLPSPAAFSIPAAPAAIDDRHPGMLVARITNTTTVPIMVCSLRPVSADSISVAATRPVRRFTVAPGGSRDVAFIARTAPGFREGSHVVSLAARVSLPNEACRQVLFADRAIDVSVFGAAQITSAVGAVSFLLVPGLLILVVMKFLWERAAPRRTLAWLGATQAEYWAGAITLSIAAIPVYYGATSLIGPGRDLITSFDSGDILRLWVGALVAGTLAWLGCFSVWSWRRIRPGSDELTVLRKLSRHRHASLKMQLAQIKDQPGTYGVAGAPDDEMILVPMIGYHSESLDVQGRLDDAVNGDRGKRFWAEARRGEVQLRFEGGRVVTQLPAASVTERGSAGRIVIRQ
jgi:hypothetical protein